MHLIDHEIDQHIKSLGLISVSSYKLWCRRNGFSTSLEKSSSEQESECAFLTAQAVPSDPRIHKNHSPRTAKYIQRIASGEFDGQPLSSMMSWIRTLFEEADEVDGGRQALLRLLLHVEKYANLLHSKQALRRLGQSRRNFIISGLSQLALHHKDWIRPVEEWFPEANRTDDQYYELSRYLLARYPVPPCLDAAWFEPNDEERHTQQGWFKHIAGGQNIRTAGCLPFTLTKRAAHKFMTTKWHNPPLIALRSAQVETLSDSNLPSWSIATNEYMWGRENADFWTSIVHFFLNNPMLERSYIGPIIDYIHHQKFVARRIPQPDGTEIEAPPAHPNFCIKSRSINKLIREVDEWHASLTGEENEAVKEWEPSGIGNFELTENNEELHCGVHWTIQELGTSSLLYVEGRRMHHCVGSYARKCVEGETSIFSIRARPIPKNAKPDDEPQDQHHVLTIAIDNKKRTITQARGKYNLQPQGKISKSKQRKTDRPYLILLRESARIMALWRQQEGLGFSQE